MCQITEGGAPMSVEEIRKAVIGMDMKGALDAVKSKKNRGNLLGVYGMAKNKKKKSNKPTTIRYFDYSLLAVMVFLICFGLVMLYSTSAYEAQSKFNDGMYYLKRQGIISMGGLVIMLFVIRIDYHRYAKYSAALYGFAMLLMALVKYSPLGYEVYGARRWLQIPGTGQTMQPAEVTKIAVILFIPYLICKMGSKVHKLKGSLMVLAWGAVAAFGVFYLTDNLSSAIIVMGIACFILFVVHKKMRPFVIIGGCGVGAFVAIAAVLGKVLENSDNFRLRRIIAWLNPEKYASSLSFQTLQGMYAIGSGGFFGKGLGNSAQKMIIPEVQRLRKAIRKVFLQRRIVSVILTQTHLYWKRLSVFLPEWVMKWLRDRRLSMITTTLRH